MQRICFLYTVNTSSVGLPHNQPQQRTTAVGKKSLSVLGKTAFPWYFPTRWNLWFVLFPLSAWLPVRGCRRCDVWGGHLRSWYVFYILQSSYEVATSNWDRLAGQSNLCSHLSRLIVRAPCNFSTLLKNLVKRVAVSESWGPQDSNDNPNIAKWN